jgi:signal transduction histidine kinase
MSKKPQTEADSFRVSYRETQQRRPLHWLRSLIRRVWDTRFENKLMLIALLIAVVPFLGYAAFSLDDLRQFALRSSEAELEQSIKAIWMLCEAQEALDRLTRHVTTEVDAVSGASPSWQEGNEFKSLRTIIKGVRLAQTGYAYAFDTVGRIMIHPALEGLDYNHLAPEETAVFLALRKQALALPAGKIGTYRYPWPDQTGAVRPKIAKFMYFKPYDWIIGVGAHENEILQPYVHERNIFLVILFTTILLVAMLVYFFSRLLMRPVKQLTRAATQIAQGDFSVEIPALRSEDEIGSLARSFKLMIVKLGHARNDLLEWSKTLEQKVDERSKELKKASERVLMSEKMASLGKLSAMVAHEINNPLSGILSYLKLSLKLLGRGLPDQSTADSITHNLEISANEIKRVGDIVRNLLMFSRQSFGDFGETHLNNVIDKSIALIKHSLEMNGLTLHKELDEHGNDQLFCDASGLQQMFVALSVNAIEAMDKGGRLTISTFYGDPDRIRLQVADTGKGIPEDVLPHIFEPFFSQKESKKSIGMGLSVVYGIVQAHHGSVAVDSRLGAGTTFTITLPRRWPADAPPPEHHKPVESA